MLEQVTSDTYAPEFAVTMTSDTYAPEYAGISDM